jgi:hypothetical protein
MTIWLLALVLLASLAGLGYRQGAIRMAISFLGILVGVLVAGPLGKLVKPAILALGVTNPVVPWLLGAPIVFVLVSITFKVVALTVHQKVDVYYKYKAGDLRLVLWERLNARTGLCIGLLNATAYLVLITTMIYPFSYWSYQMATSDSDPRWMRILDRLGKDIESTGFDKVATALNPMSRAWYEAADLAALLYQNPLLEARLSRYPAFLSLAERTEFQDLADDKDFLSLRSRRAPIMEVVNYSRIQGILQQPDLLRTIWSTVVPDMQDLRTFLETGKSPKYDPEKMLGRWKFNVNVAMAMLRRANPRIPSTEMKKIKTRMVASFFQTTFVAMTDHQAVFGHLPQVKFVAGSSAVGGEKVPCQWQQQDGKYQLSISGNDVAASIDGDRLTIGTEGLGLVFDRED